MLEALQKIDEVTLNLGSGSSLAFQISIALIMFGVALELDLRDFVKLFKNPKPGLVGIISQFLLLPALTFVLVLALGNYITPTVGLGMILVASCPGGNISNFFSNLAGGNLALSVSLTAFSSLGGFILTPLNFTFWGSLYLNFYLTTENAGLVPQLNIPFWNVIQTILLILGIPLILGVLFHFKFPKTTSLIVEKIKAISILIFISIVGIAFARDFDNFLDYIGYIFVIVLIHNLLALLSGYFLAKFAGLNKSDRKTISIETGIQNSGLAIALLLDDNIFPADMKIGGMMFITAWWGLWHIVSGITLAAVWSGFSLKRPALQVPR